MDEQAKALARYRLEKAQQVLQSADILGEAFNSRNESDYKDFFEVSRDQAEQQLCNAKRFVEIVEAYLKSQNLG
ncbi:MAG: HEPN domain-containing protein [Phascolarctobacterium sp.]